MNLLRDILEPKFSSSKAVMSGKRTEGLCATKTPSGASFKVVGALAAAWLARFNPGKKTYDISPLT
jgi:hypothetical protein